VRGPQIPHVGDQGRKLLAEDHAVPGGHLGAGQELLGIADEGRDAGFIVVLLEGTAQVADADAVGAVTGTTRILAIDLLTGTGGRGRRGIGPAVERVWR
jgi:hypothetical protein